MGNSWKGKALVTLAILVALGGIFFYFFKHSPEQPANPPPDILQRSKPASSQNFSSRRQSSTLAEEAPAQNNDLMAQILALKLPREKIEEYLKLHHRDAASLLAAFHASGDTNNPTGDVNYLKEAATNFPNDPHVQWTVLAQWMALESSKFPEDKRKWLDAFKESSPSNSLANYLSARDYFQNNQPDAAIKEILEASGKLSFGGFAMESFLNEDELYRASGKSPLEASRAALSGMASDVLPELANMKGVAQGIQSAQKQYANAGDTASVENLAQMGVGLANRFNSGDSGKLIISQLVGMAIENIALQPLNQNTSYDFLGGETPAQKLAELKQQKVALRELTQSFESIVPTMTEAETISYAERAKIYGEVAAMRWLQQQHTANTSPGGQ
jgi:hypothetical protein